MPGLILDFAGCTCHFVVVVGFLVCVFFFVFFFFSCSGSYSPKANVKCIFCTDGSDSSVECASDWYSWGSQARIDSSTRQHSFVEIGHEIISTTILSQPLYQVGQLPATVSLTVWAGWSRIAFFFFFFFFFPLFGVTRLFGVVPLLVRTFFRIRSLVQTLGS